VLIGFYYLPAIESNNNECAKEREVYEYQEEKDQGQATQGKPSKLVAYLIPVLYSAYLLNDYESACFTLLLLLDSKLLVT
jgi:hypothetical protein